MKKLVAILMIMLFGLSSSGASLQLHYCCGKLKSVTLGFWQPGECCSKGKENSDCCKTTSLSANDERQDHELYIITAGVKAPVETVVDHNQFSSPVLYHEPSRIESLHAHPVLANDIFIRNCVFRI